MIRPYKFVVQAIVQRLEDEEVVEELTLNAQTVFGVEQLVEWAQLFEDRLQEVEQ